VRPGKLDLLLNAGAAGGAGLAAGYGVARATGGGKKVQPKMPVSPGPIEGGVDVGGGGGALGVVLMGLGLAGAAMVALSKTKVSGTRLGKMGAIGRHGV
jgi:hypothetical protein